MVIASTYVVCSTCFKVFENTEYFSSHAQSTHDTQTSSMPLKLDDPLLMKSKTGIAASLSGSLLTIVDQQSAMGELFSGISEFAKKIAIQAGADDADDTLLDSLTLLPSVLEEHQYLRQNLEDLSIALNKKVSSLTRVSKKRDREPTESTKSPNPAKQQKKSNGFKGTGWDKVKPKKPDWTFDGDLNLKYKNKYGVIKVDTVHRWYELSKQPTVELSSAIVDDLAALKVESMEYQDRFDLFVTNALRYSRDNKDLQDAFLQSLGEILDNKPKTAEVKISTVYDILQAYEKKLHKRNVKRADEVSVTVISDDDDGNDQEESCQTEKVTVTPEEAARYSIEFRELQDILTAASDEAVGQAQFELSHPESSGRLNRCTVVQTAGAGNCQYYAIIQSLLQLRGEHDNRIPEFAAKLKRGIRAAVLQDIDLHLPRGGHSLLLEAVKKRGGNYTTVAEWFDSIADSGSSFDDYLPGHLWGCDETFRFAAFLLNRWIFSIDNKGKCRAFSPTVLKKKQEIKTPGEYYLDEWGERVRQLIKRANEDRSAKYPILIDHSDIHYSACLFNQIEADIEEKAKTKSEEAEEKAEAKTTVIDSQEVKGLVDVIWGNSHVYDEFDY